MVTLRESCLVQFTGSSKCSAMNISKEDTSLCRRRILSADFRLVKLDDFLDDPVTTAELGK